MTGHSTSQFPSSNSSPRQTRSVPSRRIDPADRRANLALWPTREVSPRFRQDLLSAQLRTLGKAPWTRGHIALPARALSKLPKRCPRNRCSFVTLARRALAPTPSARWLLLLRLVVFGQAELPGTDQPSGEVWTPDQAWKDEPQPQVPDTFGLPNLNPEPLAPST